MSSYSSLVLGHASLRVYYRLGESSGTTLNDSSGNALNGVYADAGITLAQTGGIANDADTAVTWQSATGTPTSPTQVVDPGTSSLLDVANGPWSIELWIKRTATGNSNAETLIAKGNGPPEIRIVGTGASQDKVAVFKGGSSASVLSAAALTDTASWHHIVATKASGAEPLLYIDGADVTTANTTGQTYTDNNTSFRIGSNTATANRCNASLDEVALYNAVLTPDEVLQHYRTGKGAIGLTDTATATDAAVKTATHPLTDSATATDAATKTATHPLADSATATDAASLGPGKGLSDSVTPTDAMTAADVLALGDSVTATDAQTITGNRTLTLADSVTATDAITLPTTDQTVPGGFLIPERRVVFRRHELTLTDLVLTSDTLAYEKQMDPDLRRQEELTLALV